MVNVKYWLVIILAFSQFTMAESLTSGNPSFLSNNSSLDALSDENFLPVEDAFQLSAWRDEQTSLVLNWHLADGYYLYKHRFGFKLDQSEKAPLKAALPAGKQKYDEYFGDTEVFYNQVNATLSYEEVAKAVTESKTIKVTYQGCADAGLCYPPQTKFIQLTGGQIDILDAPPETKTLESALLTGEQGFTRLLASASLISIIGLFFIAGLALTFTPCVLPMIPIISGIVLGQKGHPTRRRSFALSLSYVLGMALTYALAGTITGYFGAELNIQAKLQSPWFLSIFATLFVALALAMFGAYELRLPNKLQSKLHDLSNQQKGGAYFSVAFMGSISSLIVSPCVSAPLAGALVYISSTSDPVLGGFALLALGLGMGTPLLLIGTFGTQLLPKAGLWMNHVKIFFGVLMLGVAIWMLERIVPAPITLALFGVLALGYGIYLSKPLFNKDASSHSFASLMGITFALYGAVLVAGSAQGGSNPLTPIANLSGPAEKHPTLERFIAVQNLDSLKKALNEAKSSGLPVMLDIYADWCVSCQILEHKVFTQDDVSKSLENFVLLRADVTDNLKEHQLLLKHFGLFGPPSLLFFSNQTGELQKYRIQGEITAPNFYTHLQAVLENNQSQLQFALKK